MRGSSGTLRVVLAGTRGPLGGEVKRRLEAGRCTFDEVVLAEVEPLDEEGGRLLADYRGEALLVADATELDYSGYDLAVLLGPPSEMCRILDRASRARACVDASGAGRRRSGTAWAHDELGGLPARGLILTPHPVALTLARLLRPLTTAGWLRHASATVLLPAAALGVQAVEELHEQTVAIMSFQDLPTRHLPGQLAFNALPWQGPAGGLSHDIAADVAAVLGGEGPPPCDLQLLLVPSFHGYGFSLRLSLAEDRTTGALREQLAAGDVTVVDRVVTPVDGVESRRILVGPPQAAGGRTHWVWAVADSLGGGADHVVRLVEHLAEGLAAGREAAP